MNTCDCSGCKMYRNGGGYQPCGQKPTIRPTPPPAPPKVHQHKDDNMSTYDIEKKLRLMKLAGLMRHARCQFNESHKVFEWLCEMEDWYYTECPNRDHILEDIIASVGGLEFLMFDKVNGFDGRQFRDMFWSYDTIELYAQGCLAPDQIKLYEDVCWHKRLALGACVDEISKGVTK